MVSPSERKYQRKIDNLTGDELTERHQLSDRSINDIMNNRETPEATAELEEVCRRIREDQQKKIKRWKWDELKPPAERRDRTERPATPDPYWRSEDLMTGPFTDRDVIDKRYES